MQAKLERLVREQMVRETLLKEAEEQMGGKAVDHPVLKEFDLYWLLFYRHRNEGLSPDQAAGVARDLFLGTLPLATPMPD